MPIEFTKLTVEATVPFGLCLMKSMETYANECWLEDVSCHLYHVLT